ncbi:MAG: thioesterase family protein [Candidatus Eisenbacteria bacterium]|nr:thioesterase family protein [Candidatus Eisenbacteria bacterium]
MDDFSRFETPIRVRYSETDQMGQAYYANYLVWFEAARGHLMRELGLPYGRLEEAGFLLPVTRFSARLVLPARYDEELHVRLWIPAARSRGVEFIYQVRRQNDVLAGGSTHHVSVDRSGRPVRLPDQALALLRAYQNRWPVPGGSTYDPI